MLNKMAIRANRVKLLTIAVIFAVGGVLGLLFFKAELLAALHWVKDAIEPIRAAMQQQHPLIYFTLTGILTAFGFPILPFYLAGAAIYGKGTSMLYAPLSAMLTIAIGYWANLTIARPVVNWMLARAGYTIPTISPNNYLRFTILCRITPGMPATIQNTILALGGVPFGKYMLGSFPIIMCWITGFILLGESMFEGNLGLAITAVMLIVFLILALRILRSRLEGDQTNELASAPVDPASDQHPR